MRGILRVALIVSSLSFYAVSAAPAVNGVYHVKETVTDPRGWTKQSRAPSDRKIVLRIGLPQPNFSELERHLYEVSDPDHQRYGQHLLKEEVEALVAPHQESIDAIDRWLASFGLKGDDIIRSPAKDWAKVTVNVGLAENMLDTEYYVWEHMESGDNLVRTTSYSLPSNLHEHVDVIQPTTMFSRMIPQKSMSFIEDKRRVKAIKGSKPVTNAVNGILVDPSCADTITLSCLMQIYNAVGYVPSANINNSIAVTSYLASIHCRIHPSKFLRMLMQEEYASFDDLQIFYSEQFPQAINSTFDVVSVNGGLNPQGPENTGVEANLDVQFAFGVAYPIPGTFYTTPGRPPWIPEDGESDEDNDNEPYTDWLDFVLSHPDPPLAISTSYADHEQTVPQSFAIRACQSFAQLGARGVSLMFASGDAGVGDGNTIPVHVGCDSNDGKHTKKFLPMFPASCPYVTAVGATAGVAPETAVTSYYSGGGFSDYFSRPSYQDEAVTAYLAALPNGTYAGLYNPEGRGYPDVSAQGDYYHMVYTGADILAGGTSASSPTFTGFIALLNDARLKTGLSPLGFLNPFIYSKGFQGLNDITIGNNGGCGTDGFNATEGWDPVTGFGTPNFGKLKDLVVAI